MDYRKLHKEERYEELLAVLQNQVITAETIYWKMRAFWNLGQVDRALKESEKIKILDPEDKWKVKLFLQLGTFHYVQGDLEEALNYYERCLDLQSMIQDPVDLSAVISNIGLIYRDRGENLKALEQFKEAYGIVSKIQDPMPRVYSLMNAGIVLKHLNHLEESKNYLSKALSSMPENKCNQVRIYLLKELFENYLESNDEKGLERTMDEIFQVRGSGENHVIYVISRHCEALYLKHKDRLIHKATAQEIFREVIAQNEFDFNYKIDGILHLLELLVEELQAYNQESVNKEILYYSDQLLELTKDEKLYTHEIDVLIFKSKLYYVNGDFARSREFLNEAKMIAEKNELFLKLEEISDETSKLNRHMLDLKYTVESAGFEEAERLKLVEYIKSVQKHKIVKF